MGRLSGPLVDNRLLSLPITCSPSTSANRAMTTIFLSDGPNHIDLATAAVAPEFRKISAILATNPTTGECDF
jgi:hypothetical protein